MSVSFFSFGGATEQWAGAKEPMAEVTEQSVDVGEYLAGVIEQ